MKREERRQEIINLLVESRAVELDEVAARFGVSKMTIHRDLDDLERAGVLRKVRGGATIDAGTQFESDFRFRERQEADVTLMLARTAANLYWIGRLMERAEFTARLVEATIRLNALGDHGGALQIGMTQQDGKVLAAVSRYKIPCPVY